MIELIVAIWMLANPADRVELTYVKKFETIEACEAGKPEAKEALDVYLMIRYGLDPELVGNEMTCRPAE